MRQKASFLKLHGIPMSDLILKHTVTQLIELQSLYFEDGTSCDLTNPLFWERLCPQLHVGVLSLSALLAEGEECRLPDTANEAHEISLLKPRLAVNGFTVVPARLRHEDEGAALNVSLCLGLDQLALAGIPPAFILVYDEAWAVVDSQWGRVAEQLLDGEECVMEPDINVWHLRRVSPVLLATDGLLPDALLPASVPFVVLPSPRYVLLNTSAFF